MGVRVWGWVTLGESESLRKGVVVEAWIGSALGWIGTIGTFSAYVLIWRGLVGPQARGYCLLNATGGFLAAAGAFSYGAWPAFVSNLVWGLIGAHGFIMALRWRRPARVSTVADLAATESALEPSAPWHPSLTEASSISLPWLQPAISVQTQAPAAQEELGAR